MPTQLARLARPDLVLLVLVPLTVLGTSWSIVRLMLVVAIVLTGHCLLTRNPVTWRDLTPAHGALALLALLLTVSFLFPPLGKASIARYDLVTLFAGFAVVLMCTVVRLSEVVLMAGVAIAGAAASAAVLVQGQYELGRLAGLGLNCNYLGALLTLPLVAAVGLAGRQRQWAWLLATVPCLIAIAATESRAATIAAVCGVAYVFLSGRRWWWQASLLTLAAVAGLALSAVAYRAHPAPAAVPQPGGTPRSSVVAGTSAAPQIDGASGSIAAQDNLAAQSNGGSTPAPDNGTASSNGAGPGNSVGPGSGVGQGRGRGKGAAVSAGLGDRTDSELERNNAVRMQAAVLAAEVIAQHPVRGIGYAGFAGYAEASPGFAISMNTHNDFLRLGAEAGLPALIAFGLLLWLALRIRNQSAILRAIVVCYAVTLLFANTLSNLTVTIVFWAALGMLLSRAEGKVFALRRGTGLGVR